MSNIRRQSIISSVIIYIGFAVGLLNTYFFTKEGLFSTAEYGLTTIFLSIATMMTAIATMAMPSYIFKFHPYYNDNLPRSKNDQVTWALLVSVAGFVLVLVAGLALKNIVIKKYSTNASLLVTYYYWIFPLGLGLTIYTVLEAYAWSLHKSVLTNFFKEVQWRLLITLLIVLYLTDTIRDYNLFIKLFSFTYAGIAFTLFIYLIVTKKIHFTFKVSKVTRRYLKKMIMLCSFVYGGTLIFTLSQVFDTFVIASRLDDGLAKAGIFGLATTMTSIMAAPQRGIVSASIAHLSKAWKDKNLGLIQKIYMRSSINQLVFSCALFLLIWLNFEDGVNSFHLKPAYLQASWLFFMLGISKIIDMGTGVNAQIIATSVYWKFELVSGIILLSLMLPLTYFLTVNYGLIGPAIATVISISIYNVIRILFLWNKFKLFPFTLKTVYTLVLAAIAYFICYFTYRDMHGISAIVLRSLSFVLIYASGTMYLKLSPDIIPVITSIKNRFGKS